MARAGAFVVLAGRTLSDLLKVADDIRKEGGRADIHVVDLSSRREVERLAADHLEVDILVNNAAAPQRYAAITERDDAYWADVFDVDFWAPYVLIRDIGRSMSERGAGVIINISSMAGLRPFPLLAHYSAAKAALDMLTRVAAMDLGPAGVRAVSIAPGIVRSDHHPFAEDDQFVREFAPRGERIMPADIGRLAVYLASDDARFINGTVIEYDGGAGAGYFHLRPQFAAAKT